MTFRSRPSKRRTPRRGRMLLRIMVAAGACSLVIAAAAPAPAQRISPTAPFLADGEWAGGFGASGPFNIAGVFGETTYGGSFEFSVWQGAVTEGTWQLGGAGVGSHARAGGTVTFLANGTMTGSANQPEMLPVGATVIYDLMVEGVPVSGTTEFGPELMTIIFIPIISASCDAAIGDWELPANLMYTQGGGTSAITGTWSASRRLDSESDDDWAALNEAMDALMTRARALADNVYATGEFDFLALAALANEAEWFNQRLTLSTVCQGRPLRGWVNPIGATVLGLVTWALDNPEQVSDVELLQLVAAGVRTGVLGSRAPDNELTGPVRARLAVELTSRAEENRQDGNCPGAIVVNSAALAVNDPVARAATQDAMTEVCP